MWKTRPTGRKYCLQWKDIKQWNKILVVEDINDTEIYSENCYGSLIVVFCYQEGLNKYLSDMFKSEEKK